MKFLDERITFSYTFPSGTTLPSAGMYTYTLKASDATLEAEHTVFVGNFYYKSRRTFILDLTDIIRNDAQYIDNDNFFNVDSLLELDGYVYTVYWVEYTMDTTRASDEVVVANVWRYPNRSAYNDTLGGDSLFVDINEAAQNNTINCPLQGMRSNTFDLLPHYPLKITNNFAYAASFTYGSSVRSIDLTLSDGAEYEEDVSWQIPGDSLYSATYIYNLSNFLEDYFYASEHEQFATQDLNVYYYKNASSSPLIAVFDNCYGRYYLQWRDRFGSYQCQQFRDNATYSEDINTEEIITYDDIRRKSMTSIQPKWKLYSGWIEDKLYPYYESIFTSPVLVLYDTETDMSYEVLVKGSFTEKNYKNQKTLVNIELDLEAANKQNIIY